MNEPITIYRNHKTHDLLIQRYAGIYAAGRFINLSAVQMKESGLEAILKLLNDEPPSRAGETPELKAFSKDERRIFYRQHSSVSVSLKENVLLVGPYRRQGSGFVTRKDEIVNISLPSTNEEFLSVLNQAFETAD